MSTHDHDIPAPEDIDLDDLRLPDDYSMLGDPDLPRVQVPVGKSGLAIDGDHYPVRDLPDLAYEAYKRYLEADADVYQCDNCGYLTQSDRVGEYRGYQCGNCGANLGYRQNYTKVYGSNVPDDHYLDVPNLDPDAVPNAKSHLSRIQNEAAKAITMDELLYATAVAVKAYRDRHGSLP